MPTSSFDKEFIISDPGAIKKLEESLANPVPVKFTKHDLEEENRKGLALLAKAFHREWGMKMVVNTCIGGFGLSKEAMQLYAKKQGFELFFYRSVSDGKFFRDEDDLTFPMKKNYGNSFTDIDFDDYFDTRGIKREDPILVEVVEELGKEANGNLAELKIITVPYGLAYEIYNDHGVESVHESHSVWS